MGMQLIRREAKARWLVLLGIVVALTLSMTVVYTRSLSADDSTPKIPDWPAFTMTYMETGHFRGRDEPPLSTTYVLDYENRYSWSKEVIESEVDPSQVGTVYRFDGSDLVISEPKASEPIVRPTERDGEVVAPERWLVPGTDTLLVENRDFEVAGIDSASQRLTISRDQMIPCVGGTDSVGVTEPDACANEDSWTSTDVITYRTDVSPAIPVEMTSFSNGEEVGSLTVTDLAVHE
jgi:hypothetical protein